MHILPASPCVHLDPFTADGSFRLHSVWRVLLRFAPNGQARALSIFESPYRDKRGTKCRPIEYYQLYLPDY
jgi:hypothetical protein